MYIKILQLHKYIKNFNESSYFTCSLIDSNSQFSSIKLKKKMFLHYYIVIVTLVYPCCV